MQIDAAIALERIEDPHELWDEILAAFAAAGFEFVIYLAANDALTQTQVLTNIPEIYADTDPLTDPFLHYCCDSYDVTRTGPEYLPDYEYLPPDAQAFIRRASETGMISGLGVPTRLVGSARFGGFNIGTRLTADAFEAQIADSVEAIRSFCLLAHRRLEEVFPPVSQNMARLSPRERDVIAQIIKGASRKECARALDLSPNTVADYTKSAYRKLGVSNRAEAAHKLRD